MEKSQWKKRSETIMRLHSILIEGGGRLDPVTSSLPRLAEVDSPITWQRCIKAYENRERHLTEDQSAAAESELKVLAVLLFSPKEAKAFAEELDFINDDKNWKVSCNGEMWAMQQGKSPKGGKVTTGEAA